MKSPPWVREEIILALEHYIRDGRRVPEPTDPSVMLLSHQLNMLPLIPKEQRAPNFRNSNGVVLKIANLRAFDPLTSSKGMSAGSKLDKAIFDEFQDNPRGLMAEAADIRLRYGLGASSLTGGGQQTQRQVAEGREHYSVTLSAIAIHERLERDMETGAARKAESASLSCEVCGFDFGRMYGERGTGYIQFHHRAPLSSLTEQTRPTPSDLSMICANCHAMLHARDETLSVEELKAVVRDVQRAGIRDLAAKVKPRHEP